MAKELSKEEMQAIALPILAHFGDAARKQFFAYLAEQRFCTTKCTSCNEIAFPPRLFCPRCFGKEVEWVDMPNDGKLYAFTYQERSPLFPETKVIGIVEVKGIGFVVTDISADFASLEIGQPMKVNFITVLNDIPMYSYQPA